MDTRNVCAHVRSMGGRKSRILFWDSSVAFLVLAAPPAFAQATAPTAAREGLGEIIVTARRVEESLQRVPAAVSAVTPLALELKSIVEVDDLAVTVPGFTAQTVIQQGAPVYSIRGQHGTINVNATSQPAVQVYFAEMSTASGIGTSGAFYDLAGVQVLKGPQGTLFGRNSTGGAVLITPKAPTDRFEGYVRGSYGNYDALDVEGVVNLPLGDKIAVRIGAKLTQRDGYIRNVIDNTRNGGERNEDSERISLMVAPSEMVKSTFIATRFSSDTRGAMFKLAGTDPRFLENIRLDLGGLLTSALAQDAITQTSRGFYGLGAVYTPYVDDLVTTLQNTTEIELSDALKLKNIVGYRRTKEDQFSEYTGVTLGFFGNRIESLSKLFTEELQLQGKAGKLDFVVGGYFYHENIRAEASSEGFSAILQFANRPGMGGFPIAFPIRDFLFNDYQTRAYSAYVHVNYDLSSAVEGLSVSAGARWTRDLKRVVFHTFNNNGVDLNVGGYLCRFTNVTTPTPDEASCALPARIVSNEPTYDISLNYQINNDVLVYAAHRHGFRAGGFDINPANVAQLSYQPEFVDDIEGGIKADFNLGQMAGRFNGAAYYQFYKDIQRLVARPTPTGSIPSITVNAAAARIFGLDAELTLKPSPAFEINATYAYIKPKYKEWTDLYRSPLSGVTSTIDISDSKFSYVAKHQFSVTGTYDVPIPDDKGDLTLSATWYGQSSMIASDNNTADCGPDGRYTFCANRGVKIPAYNLVNLSALWRNVGGENFDLGLFVTNVFDKKYFSSVISNLSTLGTLATQAGPPRMYWISLKFALGGE